MNVDSIVDIDYLLGTLSTDRSTSINEYSRIMDHYPNKYEELISFYSRARPEEKKTKKPLDSILREICLNEIDFDLVKKGSKKSYLMKYKKEFIEKARKLGYRSEEIGEAINISPRAVGKHISIN